MYVDLPADLRGSHMSRNVEAFNEIVEASARDPAPGLEDVCLSMARELLADGSALRKFQEIVEAQGGKPGITSKDVPIGEHFEPNEPICFFNNIPLNNCSVF